MVSPHHRHLAKKGDSMRYGIGALVKSLAGHDKDNLFIIIEESEEYVSLMDGKFRTRQNPKCKNKKHVQVIHDNDEPQRRKLIEENGLTDEDVKYFIKCYKKKSVAEENPQQ